MHLQANKRSQLPKLSFHPVANIIIEKLLLTQYKRINTILSVQSKDFTSPLFKFKKTRSLKTGLYKMISLHCYSSSGLYCLLNNATPYVKHELKKHKMQNKKKA